MKTIFIKFAFSILMLSLLVQNNIAQDYKFKQQIFADSMFANCNFSAVAFNESYILAKQNLYHLKDTINIPYVLIKRDNNTWRKQSEIRIPNSLTSYCAYFGESIGISNDFLAIGAPKSHCVVNNSQYLNGVYLYRLDENEFSKPIRIADPDSASNYLHFGDNLFITNTTLAVQGRRAYANEDQSISWAYPGSVYIFQLNSEKQWQYSQRIDWPEPIEKTEIDFGISICAKNDWLFIGAPASTLQEDTSSVYIYSLNDEKQYELKQKIKTPWHTYGVGAGYRYFGTHLEASDSVLAVFDKLPIDTVRENTYYYSGAIHIYLLKDNIWQKSQTLISEDNLVDEGYRYFSLDNTHLALVNTVNKESNGIQDYVGKVSIFEKKMDEFVLKQTLFPPDHQQYDNFGKTFYLSNNQLLINNPSRDTVINNTLRIANIGKIYVYSTNMQPDELSNNSLKEEKFRLYPNPVKEKLNFVTEGIDTFQFGLYSITGKEIYSKTVNQTSTIHLEQIPNGFYIYKIWNNSTLHSGTIVIKH